jgi:uncharacterized repeat protein (TIGR01451 family)
MERSLLRTIAAVFTIAGFLAIAHSSTWAQTADLAVSMSADRLQARIGEHVVYRILVTNLGPNDATGVNLSLGSLPDQLDSVCFVCGAGTPGPELLSCSIGTLASGASVESILVVRVSNTLSGPQGRLASVDSTVSSTTTDPNGSNNTAEVTIKIIGAKG